MEELKQFAKDQGAPEADDLIHWDTTYWSERLRESKYETNEVWNSDVKFYCVKDSSGSPIAYFYFDPYSRPSKKRGGAWMDEVVARSRYFHATVLLLGCLLHIWCAIKCLQLGTSLAS
ncbi:putative cytosolic oligopeptidase A [Apium graveolens]|uniref:putative cytosolic oligopeptidase A n=1 Tax=Apium graveolens TaxID=4045 RepID=UPI003D7B78F9